MRSGCDNACDIKTIFDWVDQKPLKAFVLVHTYAWASLEKIKQTAFNHSLYFNFLAAVDNTSSVWQSGSSRDKVVKKTNTRISPLQTSVIIDGVDNIAF